MAIASPDTVQPVMSRAPPFLQAQGKQYTPAAYAALAEENQVTLSVGRTGQCWDNALAKSFLSPLKGELTDTGARPSGK